MQKYFTTTHDNTDLINSQLEKKIRPGKDNV